MQYISRGKERMLLLQRLSKNDTSPGFPINIKCIDTPLHYLHVSDGIIKGTPTPIEFINWVLCAWYSKSA